MTCNCGKEMYTVGHYPEYRLTVLSCATPKENCGMQVFDPEKKIAESHRK
jgi:hypothetical protein